jgi:hypothetical protein
MVKFKNILAQKKEFETRVQKKESQTQDTSCSGDPPLTTSIAGQLAASDIYVLVTDQQQKTAFSEHGTTASSKQKQQLDVSDKKQLSALKKQQELVASNNKQPTGSGEEQLIVYCEQPTTGMKKSTASAGQLLSEVATSRVDKPTTAPSVVLQQPAAVVEQPKKNKWNKKKPNISNTEVSSMPRASSTGRNEDTKKTRVRMDYSCYIAEPGAPPFREQSPVFGPPSFQPFGRERAQVRGQAPFRAHSANVGLLPTPADSLLPTPDEASVRRQASNHRPASYHRQDSNYRQASKHRQPARRGQSSNRMQATYNYRDEWQDPRYVAGQE